MPSFYLLLAVPLPFGCLFKQTVAYSTNQWTLNDDVTKSEWLKAYPYMCSVVYMYANLYGRESELFSTIATVHKFQWKYKQYWRWIEWQNGGKCVDAKTHYTFYVTQTFNRLLFYLNGLRKYANVCLKGRWWSICRELLIYLLQTRKKWWQTLHFYLVFTHHFTARIVSVTSVEDNYRFDLKKQKKE